MADGDYAMPGHNVGGIDGNRLLSIVQRFEKLGDEIKQLQEDQRDIMKEAGSAGFDKKVLRSVIRLRAMDQNKRDEMDHLTDLYRRVLGV